MFESAFVAEAFRQQDEQLRNRVPVDEMVYKVKPDALYGFMVSNPMCASTMGGGFNTVTMKFLGMDVVVPCKYCGRTKQKHEHKQCDGCGASKRN